MAFLEKGFLLASVFKDITMFSRVLTTEKTPYNNFPVSATAIPASGSLTEVELVKDNTKLLTVHDVTDPLVILDVQFGIPVGIRMFRQYPSSEPLRGKPYNFTTPTVDSPYGYWDSTNTADSTEMQFYPIFFSRFSFKNTTTAAITLTLNVDINECRNKILSPDSTEDMRFIKETIHEWYKNPVTGIFRIDIVGGNQYKAEMPHLLKEVVQDIPLQDVL